MILNLFLLFVSVLLAVYLTVVLTYTLQIKEYRRDRFVSYLREKGFISLIDPINFRFPKKSVRNFNIAKTVVFGLGIYNLIVLCCFFNSPYFYLQLVLNPIISVMLVIFAVWYTKKIVLKKRGEVIMEASKKINDSKAEFIGITGSFGKSSTKELLYQILSPKFNTCKSKENYNTDIGVAMSINESLTTKTKYFIVEMGAYKIGEIKTICDFVKPKYAILTGLSNQHIDIFGSFENIISAKSELLKSIPETGSIYINMDSFGYEKTIQNLVCKRIVSYSLYNQEADIYTKKIIEDNKNNSTTFNVVCRGELFEIFLPLVGINYVQNLLPCIGLARDFGISKDVVIETISNFQPITGKLSIHKAKNNSVYINDSYNSNVEGFLLAIEKLSKCTQNNKVVISKGIIELGNEKIASYLKIIELLKKYNINLITTDPLFKKLYPECKLYKSESDIILNLIDKQPSDYAILVEGRFSDKFIQKLDLK